MVSVTVLIIFKRELDFTNEEILSASDSEMIGSLLKTVTATNLPCGVLTRGKLALRQWKIAVRALA